MSRPTRHRGHMWCQALLGLLCLGLIGGCHNQPGPRRLPFPTLNPRAPFPELSGAATSKKSGAAGGSGKQSAYEEAIAQALHNHGAAKVPSDATQSIQTVPLGGRLVGNIPLNFDDWKWASGGNITVITHTQAGHAPDALIYAESFSPGINSLPSMEMERFFLTVDPSMATTPVFLQAVGIGAASVAAQLHLLPSDVARAAQISTTTTLGHGIGYQSTPHSFTGWRWDGHNAHRTEIRLGRVSGVWGPQAGAKPHMSDVFAKLATKVPQFAAIRQEYNNVGTSSGAQKGPIRPAYMLIGSATVRRNYGVHLAIICEQAPQCPVASDLANFLDSIRLPGEGAGARPGNSGQQSNVTGFASKYAGFDVADPVPSTGIPLAASPGVVNAATDSKPR